MTAILEHAAVVVADLDGAVAWYGEWFGAAEVKRSERPELGIRAAVISLGGGLVEIIEPREPAAPLPAGTWPGTFFSRPGMHHLALGVDDAAAMLERMQAGGVKVLTGLVENRLFFCRDPWGALLEIKQRQG